MNERNAEAFDPSQYLTKVSGKDYLEVKFRLLWAHHYKNQFGYGLQIKTEHIALTDQFAVFRATVIVTDGETVILAADGHGSETPGDFRDYIEKAETKAVGRALAAAGFGTQFVSDFDTGISHADGSQRIVDAPVDTGQRRGSGTAGNLPVGQAPTPMRKPDGNVTVQATTAAPTPRQLVYVEAILNEMAEAGHDVSQHVAQIPMLNRQQVSDWIETMQTQKVLPALLPEPTSPKA